MGFFKQVNQMFQTHLGFGKVQVHSPWPADIPLNRRGSIKIVYVFRQQGFIVA